LATAEDAFVVEGTGAAAGVPAPAPPAKKEAAPAPDTPEVVGAAAADVARRFAAAAAAEMGLSSSSSSSTTIPALLRGALDERDAITGSFGVDAGIAGDEEAAAADGSAAATFTAVRGGTVGDATAADAAGDSAAGVEAGGAPGGWGAPGDASFFCAADVKPKASRPPFAATGGAAFLAGALLDMVEVPLTVPAACTRFAMI
jgi:hypothetical protein